MKYTNKYYKLKKDYLDLKYHISEYGDDYDQPEMDPDQVFYFETEKLPDTELEDITDKLGGRKGKFQGFDEFLTYNETEQKIKDVGINKTTRGKTVPYYYFSKSDFIKITDKPNDKKILYIKTVDEFDIFTEKYGIVKNKSLFIEWDEIAKNYRGFYVSDGVYGERENEAPLKGKTYTSWLDKDYKHKDVVIFDKSPQFSITGKDITKPFKGIIYESYGIPSTEFVTFQSKDKINKVLLIDSLEVFDIFTNTYGELNKKTQQLDINWKKVNKILKGFYIDQKLKMDRYKLAFYEGEQYKSWWEKNGLGDVVYVFNF